MFTFAQIEITTNCNAACQHCNNSKYYNGKRGANISYDKFQTILNKIVPQTNNIHLQGLGEPFLHPEIEKLLFSCKENSLITSTTTNGTVINEKAIEFLDTIYVSLDGITPWRGYQRQGISSKKTIATLMYVSELANGPAVYITTVVSDNNLMQVEEILKLAHESRGNIAGVILSPLLDFSKSQKSLSETGKKELQKIVSGYSDINLHAAFLKNLLIQSCGWLENKIYFDIDGNLRPCCIRSNPDDIRFGNIFNQGIDETVSGEKVYSFLQSKNRGIVDFRCRLCMMNGSHLLWA